VRLSHIATVMPALVLGIHVSCSLRSARAGRDREGAETWIARTNPAMTEKNGLRQPELLLRGYEPLCLISR
jgi:hypothetical protein